ncbi:MAG: metal ABC transporter ATP-binding protein [Rickettsiaceae bacterium]|nr:metal ABC transporter ATP-binding protein [Rickettsiaceae bacterium]
MDTLVEFKSLSKSFGNKLLVDNVSFKLKKGEITTLIGQNGAGKTTLAKIILKLENYNKGQLIIRKNLRIGYVPQKLDFGFSMPLTSKGLLDILSPNGNNDDVIDLHDFIHYDKIKNTDISEISGGELQKLMLAGTLMNKPDLLILDEPTQFLDVTSQQEFYRLLAKLRDSLNLTTFMISHDLFTVMKNSDQVICLNGHVCCSGKPTDINQDIGFTNALSEIGVYIHKHNHEHIH